MIPVLELGQQAHHMFLKVKMVSIVLRNLKMGKFWTMFKKRGGGSKGYF